MYGHMLSESLLGMSFKFVLHLSPIYLIDYFSNVFLKRSHLTADCFVSASTVYMVPPLSLGFVSRISFLY